MHSDPNGVWQAGPLMKSSDMQTTTSPLSPPHPKTQPLMTSPPLPDPEKAPPQRFLPNVHQGLLHMNVPSGAGQQQKILPCTTKNSDRKAGLSLGTSALKGTR